MKIARADDATSTASEAVEWFGPGCERPDIVITDVRMPPEMREDRLGWCGH